MLIIPKKDFPKDLNPLGLKRGDKVELEIADSTPDYITIDPSSLKLKMVRDLNENRPPLVKPKKVSNTASMPLPALKSMIQNPPAPAPAGPAPMPPMPPAK